MTSESSAEFTKVAYDVLCFYTNIDCSFFFFNYFKNPFIFDSIYLWKRMIKFIRLLLCYSSNSIYFISSCFYKIVTNKPQTAIFLKSCCMLKHKSLHYCPVYEGSAELITCLWHSTPSPI